MDAFCSSPWVPAEWIAAHGLDPRGVWSAAPGSPGAAVEGVCGFAQHLADCARNNPDAAVIFTTACDQMRRAADAANRRQSRVFLFNLPATWQTRTARRLYLAELERLGRFCEQVGGRRPTDKDLNNILRDWDQRRQRLRELLPQVSARDAAEMLLSFFDRGLVPDTASPAPSRGIPLALVGGPILRAQLDLFDAIESIGGWVALNALEPGERCLLPPLPPSSAGPLSLETLANQYFDHSVDVFHRPNSRLYTWLGPRLAERGIRGIVLWVHVGCDLWRAEAASLREAFDLSVLILDEHEARGVSLRDLTRLSAFVEALR